MDPKISIIIPVYNVAAYVERCLESVIEQSYQNLEIVIVDDCGPDNSMDIVRAFCASHEGDFVLLAHEKNRGQSAARNTGIKASSGDYLFFLDSDDELPQDAMLSLVNAIRKKGHADFLIGNCIVHGNYNFVNLTTPPVLESSEIFNAYIGGKLNDMACGKMIDRNFFISSNLWLAEGRIHEDVLYSFQLAMAARKMITVTEPIYIYKIREGSTTTGKREKNYIDMFWIIEQKIRLINESEDWSNEESFHCLIGVMFAFVVKVSVSELPWVKKRILVSWIKQLKCRTRLKAVKTKYRIHSMMIAMPFCLSYPLFRWYGHLRNA